MEQANGEHLLDGAVYQNCEEQDLRYITAKRNKNTVIDFENHNRDEAILNKSKATSNQPTKKPAFTLVESIIALAIVGIVAALTIAVFIPKINEHVRTRQISAAKIKFTKAMEIMALNDDVGPYYSDTLDFVNSLQKYFKIAKICDKDHLADCMGYDKIQVENGEDVKLEYINNGNNFGMLYDDENDFTGDTAGIVTLDGTSMILVWNKKCPILPAGVYEWSGDTNIATSCVAMVMDVNTDSKPNKYNKDIVLFNARKLTKCGIEFTYNNTKYCWSAPFRVSTPLTSEECNQRKSELGIKNCRTADDDYWGGLLKTCGGTKNLPDVKSLAALAGYLYNQSGAISYSSKVEGTLNQTKLANFPELYASFAEGRSFHIWSNSEYSSGVVNGRHFYGTNSIYTGSSRNLSNRNAVCVIK